MSTFAQDLIETLKESKPGDELIVWPDTYSPYSKHDRKSGLNSCHHAANAAGATIKCRCKLTGIHIEVIE